MSVHKVTVILQTADRTRKAQVTVPRTMTVADVIKASRGRWHLSMGMDFQIVNMNTNRQLLAHDTLNDNNVQNGDVLMLQPFPTHGGGGEEKGERRKEKAPAFLQRCFSMFKMLEEH